MSDAEKNRNLRNYFAVYSHELRNHVGNVYRAMELAIRQAEHGKIDILRSILKAALLESDHAVQIIDDDLSMAQMEAGKMPVMAMAESNIRQFFKDVVDRYNSLYSESGPPLKLSIGSEMPEIVRTDEFQLRSILANLIGNALKHSSRDLVYISVDRIHDQWSFIISNRSAGVNKYNLTRLFDPYYTSGTTHGFGLGLYIVKMKVQALGGEISISTGEDDIIFFKVQFPL